MIGKKIGDRTREDKNHPRPLYYTLLRVVVVIWPTKRVVFLC